jgi:hypothetical protein
MSHRPTTYTQDFHDSLQAIGLDPRGEKDNRTVTILIDNGPRPDLSDAFRAAGQGTNVYGRWHMIRFEDNDVDAAVLLGIELELPRLSRFYLRFGLKRGRATDLLVLEECRDAIRMVLHLSHSGDEIEFPSPLDPAMVLKKALDFVEQ